MADAWFVGKGSERSGPFSADVLRDMAAGGRLTPTDLVWQEGVAAWAPATSVPRLFATFQPIAAPSLSDNPYAAPALGNDVSAPASGDATALGLASRPYSFSAAFSLAVNTFKSQWIILFLAGLILLGAGIAAGVPQWIAQAVGQASGDPGVFQFMSTVGAIVGFALNLFVSNHVFAGSVVAAANAARGHGRVADVFLGFKRYGTVLLTNLLVTLIAAGVAIVGFVPLLAAAFAADAIQGWNRNPEMQPVAAILVGTCMIAIFLTAAVIGVRIIFAPALAADPENGDLNAFAALWLSWSRTSGGRGFSLLGLAFVGGLIMIVFILLFCVCARVGIPDWQTQLIIYASILLLGVGYFLLGIPLALAAAGAAYQLLFRSDRAATAAG
jgi:hypothetical protein